MTRHGTLPGRSTRNGVPVAVAWTYRSATATEDAARHVQVAYELRMIRQQAAAEVLGWFPDDGYEWRREAQLAAAEEPPVLIDEPDPEPDPEPAPPPGGRCNRCGYLLARCTCPGGPRA